jgi:NAD+ synthase (glutamine-hydrolysing)
LQDCKGLHVVVGHPSGQGQRQRSVFETHRRNLATVLSEGQVVTSYAKRQLPNYQVFDERRYFEPGDEPGVFEVAGHRVGLLICEDAWFDAPARSAAQAGAEVLAVLNASPFHANKGGEREATMRERCAETGLPLVYCHLVGGQDEVIFEGRSFVMNAQGQVQGRAAGFVETVYWATWTGQAWQAECVPMGDTESDLWHALVLGVRDYVGKNGFPGALLGLSGGIDSALVLAIAVDALGPERVRTVMMPSPYTAEISVLDARDMAQRLGVRHQDLSIVPMFEAFLETLADDFKGLPLDTTEENIQARVRGTLLMALSNKTGAIVLTTGNKSEMATGYCTLYGDMAGGFAVIKDVFKTMVFRLARWRNQNDPYGRGSNPIPERIITRPPSAELKPDQTDQDSLPEYEVLDALLARYMEEDESAASLKAAGFAPDVVDKVTRLLRINEYKRRQSPVGIRVSHRSFGKDWRYPITNQYRG